MKRRQFLASTVLSTAVAAAADGPSHQRILESTIKAKEWVRESYFSFAMGYFLKPLGDQDKRPRLSNDPFAARGGAVREEYVPSLRVLQDEKSGTLDIANLVASATHRVRVSEEKLLALAKALLESDVEASVSDCYEPHHIVICYGEMGGITGVIEICLTCVGFRIYPGGRLLRTSFYDMAQVARVLAEVGLPLNEENSSIEDYVKQLNAKIELRKNSGKENEGQK